jgi:beta-glucosidase-like glycosyl hydrolase
VLRARELSRPDRVLATAKHYAGDGDTEYGTGSGDYPIDQGITVSSRRDFARIDLAPYVPAVRKHKVGSVMPSFSSVDWTDDGVGDPLKMHAHRELIRSSSSACSSIPSPTAGTWTRSARPRTAPWPVGPWPSPRCC